MRRSKVPYLVVLFACAAVSASFAQSVTISYTLSRLSRSSTDQFAIWIEDDKGGFVKTLFVTNFTGRRAGWRARPGALPRWVQAAGVKSQPQASIDAVSGATPHSGKHAVAWDLRDASGKPVPRGTYSYLIEGNLAADTWVLWVGTITVAEEVKISPAKMSFVPTGSAPSAALISEVSALYQPN